jgi:hypothetical protein
MMRRLESDFWQVGVVPLPIAACVEPANLAAVRERIQWLPDPGPWRYLADPFGVQRGDLTHVFVEAFDYRTKHAVIEHHEIGADHVWHGCETVLAQPIHLSYPYLIEDGGEVFMVPESQRAQEIALYRAKNFPRGWVRETVLLPGIPAAEASLIRHHGRWWMFFTIVGRQARDQRELHVAFAEKLTGPWHLHPQNPVLDDRGGARPGGTPFVGADGIVTLPVQDCRGTYGGALRFLRFTVLETDRIVTEHLATRLSGDLVSSTHVDGLHTMASCGALTLIDAKRIDRSRSRHWIDWRRRTTRLWHRFRR